MKKILLIIGLLFSFSLAAIAQDSQTNRENDVVRQVVQDYLGDNIELKQRTLSPDAKIIGVNSKSGKVTATPFSKPRKTIKGAIEIHPTQRIVAVDVAPGAATVKVESEFAPFSAGEKARRHFQYLSLLKLAGEWKIVSDLMPTEFEESASK
ncbi:MAG: nuclear transport factor 2 family protein [Acidobacteria bacterium]|jgi:hypothetical protein|nr:nuclear transport factor 2 family protein [Acidobacteriota bacterium]